MEAIDERIGRGKGRILTAKREAGSSSSHGGTSSMGVKGSVRGGECEERDGSKKD
jgi:hypothetical protein